MLSQTLIALLLMAGVVLMAAVVVIDVLVIKSG
jgi:hypothetical protein